MVVLADQLAALATMSPAQLRAEWRRVHQSPPSSRLTTDLLRRGIAYRLQERIHGGQPSRIARELADWPSVSSRKWRRRRRQRVLAVAHVTALRLHASTSPACARARAWCDRSRGALTACW